MPKHPNFMKIAIVGAGVVGVTTAFELALDGHAVTVFEQRSATAEEASFATGGLLAPGVLDPGQRRAPPAPACWAAMRQCVWAARFPLAELSWLRRWRRAARQCPQRYTLALVGGTGEAGPLQPCAAAASGRVARPGLRTQPRHLCCCCAHRATQKHLPRSGARCAMQARPSVNSIQRRLAPSNQASRPRSPWLAPCTCRTDWPATVGSLRCCCARPRSNAARSLSSTPASPASLAPRQAFSSKEHLRPPFDAVVLCAGVQSAALLRPLGLRLPLVALYGIRSVRPARRTACSAGGRRGRTDPNHHGPPGSAGARLGRRRTGPQHGKAHPQTLNTLYRVLGECFPGGVTHSSGVQVWRGASVPCCPMAHRCWRDQRAGPVAQPRPWRQRLVPGLRRCARTGRSDRRKSPDIDLEGLGAQRF